MNVTTQVVKRFTVVLTEDEMHLLAAALGCCDIVQLKRGIAYQLAVDPDKQHSRVDEVRELLSAAYDTCMKALGKWWLDAVEVK